MLVFLLFAVQSCWAACRNDEASYYRPAKIEYLLLAGRRLLTFVTDKCGVAYLGSLSGRPMRIEVEARLLTSDLFQGSKDHQRLACKRLVEGRQEVDEL